MESELEKLADEMMSEKQARGILCADECGLNVLNRGTLSNLPADLTIDLLKIASSLEPDLPISSIVIKFTGIDGSSLSITKEGTLTTTVHRADRKK